MSSLILPSFKPDMTFYAWMSLTQLMNGKASGAYISQQLLGCATAGTRLDFPSNLSTFCKRTSNAFGDPFRVAIEHTVLPFYLAFRPESFLDDSVRIMAGESVEALKFKLGITPAHMPGLTGLKFCPECYKEDAESFGVAYWHRKHQLPTTHICTSHLTPLNNSKLRSNGLDKHTLELPHTCSTYSSSGESNILKSISSISSNILMNNLLGGFDSNRLQCTYRHGLKELGFITPAGKIRAESFVSKIGIHFKDLKSLEPYRTLLTVSNLPYFLKLIRKPRGNYSPVAHILLIEFLFGSWALFTSTYLWQSQFQLDFNEHPSAHSTNESNEFELAEISARHLAGEPIKKLALIYGYDIGTLMRKLGKAGLSEINRRPKKVFTEQIESVLGLLKAGKSLVEIQSETKLSKSTVDRILTSHSYIRETWLSEKVENARVAKRKQLSDLISIDPMLTAKGLREQIGPTMKWLAKNDKQWLQSILHNLQKKTTTRKRFNHRPRVDWAQRDSTCLKALMNIETFEIESWERLKPPLILRRLQYLPFKPRLDKLPLSKAWINNKLELIAENVDE